MTESPNRFSSGWKGNAAVITLLILIMTGYYYWQVRAAERTFAAHVLEHARMVADVIGLNAERAVLSQKIIEKILETFLGNAARFVDYLDGIEPFAEDELAAFAAESGLSGIKIIRESGETEGPSGWLPENTDACSSIRLRYLASAGLYLLSIPRATQTGCILLGFDDARIRKMGERVGLKTLLEHLNALSGIQYIRLDASLSDRDAAKDAVPVIRKDTAEVRLSIDSGQLIIGMEARHFFQRQALIRNEFFAFTGVLLFLGLLFSWLLHRHQSAFLAQVRRYERRLAREQEDAALGRASATITHEIRNPLNAISMGLQRLQIEADDISADHRFLIGTLLEAVGRTDGIVRELRRYAQPIQPRCNPVSLSTVLERMLTLYQALLTRTKIEIEQQVEDAGEIQADPDLMSEVFENIIKNAIEAQPDGGWLAIRMNRRGRQVKIVFENSGYDASLEKMERMTDPYVTTKTRGSGLGLAIVSRIIQAHGGSVSLDSPDSGIFQIAVSLPVGVPTPIELNDKPPGKY